MSWLIWAAVLFVIYKLVTAAGGSKGAPKPQQIRGGETAARRDAVSAGVRAPHEVLGVAANASLSEVRRAYQELIRQYHPDRLGHAAPELRELAEKRTKEINAAYEVMKARAEQS